MCSLAETSALLSPASENEIFGDSVKNAQVLGFCVLYQTGTKLKTSCFPKGHRSHLLCPGAVQGRQPVCGSFRCCTFIFWSKWNAAKTGRRLTSHPCVSPPDLAGIGAGAGRGWGAGQAEMGDANRGFQTFWVFSQPLLSPPPLQVLLASHDG